MDFSSFLNHSSLVDEKKWADELNGPIPFDMVNLTLVV